MVTAITTETSNRVKMDNFNIFLTRKDVTRCEIETAIALLSTDPVSCHVLASAASEVLRGIAKSRGKISFSNILQDMIVPNRRAEWNRALNDKYNFFKHANRDPERQVNNFNPETNCIALFGAVYDYSEIYGHMTIPMYFFRAWYFCRYPNTLKSPDNELTRMWTPLFRCPSQLSLYEALAELRAISEYYNTHKIEIEKMLTPEQLKSVELH